MDLKVQHRQLQERTRKLAREEQDLLRRTQVMAEEHLVRDSALSSLHMRDVDSRSKMVASLPSRLKAKYAGPSSGEASGESAIAALPAPRGEKSLTEALVSFVDVSRAEAASRP